MADNNFMEQEAIRRANEMQSRVPKNTGNNRNFFSGNQAPPFAVNARQSEVQSQHSERQSENTAHVTANNEQQPLQSTLHTTDKENKNLIDLLMRDKDRSIIMMLILILSSEGADAGLILALMYLII